VKAGISVLVQPSSIRVFHDKEYAAAGAVVREDLSPADVILAVKEVPTNLLIPDKTYLFFSHTIKAQPYNMNLLDEILAKNIQLIDYERIVDANGQRLVKFGKFAGNAGMIDCLAGIGDRLLALGHATPFLYTTFARGYPSLAAAKSAVAEIGRKISQEGIPASLHPFTFSFVGSGAVFEGAREVFEQLPHEYVSPAELRRLVQQGGGDRGVVYGVRAGYESFVERTDGLPYSREFYRRAPEQHRSLFHEKVRGLP